MLLIVDSGSTKAEWCFIDGDNKEYRVKTQGISPFFLKSEQIEAIIRNELLPGMPLHQQVQQIHFYGTGCSSEKNTGIVQKALNAVFLHAAANVEHDLMAAAHALCGRQPGIVCILGTGSNSCYFNGTSIGKNNPGLGYILGDEGSGAYLGKKILQSYLYGRFSESLKAAFESRFQVTEQQVLEKIYSAPLANRYMASLSVFLSENRGNSFTDNILFDGLNDFFKEHISVYPESLHVPVHFTGSIAWVYSDVIKTLCDQHNLTAGIIEKEPMDGLVRYYSYNATV